MGVVASQITCVSTVNASVCSGGSKKASNLCVTGLCEEISPVTDEFPTQRASNAKNVYIWWLHYDWSFAVDSPYQERGACLFTLVAATPIALKPGQDRRNLQMAFSNVFSSNSFYFCYELILEFMRLWEIKEQVLKSTVKLFDTIWNV